MALNTGDAAMDSIHHALDALENTRANSTAPPAAASSSSISFSFNGKQITIRSGQFHPRTTLLDYIRENTKFSGTKVSCAQGGCGACNVTLTSYGSDGTKQYASINACLKPLLSLDGAAVTTTEGIGSCQDGVGYHPIQERVAACNGAQCGFCTPGHVMSMWSLLKEKEGQPIGAQEIEGRFDGNICRCTGYRAIMTAMSTFASDGDGNYSEDIKGLPAKDFEEYDPLKHDPAEPTISTHRPLQMVAEDGTEWLKVTSIAQLSAVATDCSAVTKMVVGNTSVGVYPDTAGQTRSIQLKDGQTPTRYIDISGIPELSAINLTDSSLEVGAAVKISELEKLLRLHSDSSPNSFGALAEHLQLVGNWQVRNAGSWAGNLAMTKKFGFAGDLATILMAAGATLTLVMPNCGGTQQITVAEFLGATSSFEFKDQLIVSMSIPFTAAGEKLVTFRQALRSTNAHPLLNAGLRATLAADGSISNCSLVLGVVSHHGPMAMAEVEAFLNGRVANTETLQGVLKVVEGFDMMSEDQYHTTMQPEGKDQYRKELLDSCLFMLLSELSDASPNGERIGDPESALKHRKAGSGTQMWLTDLPDDHPGKHPTTKPDAVQLASGECKYSNDVPPTMDTLYAAYVIATKAPAKVLAIPKATALGMPGVEFFVDYTCTDAESSGAVAFIVGEEPLLVAVGDMTQAVGQGVALVVAQTRREAEEAAAMASTQVEYEDVASKRGVYGITQAVAEAYADTGRDPQEARESGCGENYNRQADATATEAVGTDQHIVYPTMREVSKHWGTHPGETGDTSYGEVRVGDVGDLCWDKCTTVVEGEFLLGGQSHFTIEKHSTTAVPEEGGRYTLFASTQQPDDTHWRAAELLGVSKDKVTVRMKRAGGAFGSRCTKSYHVSLAAALCAKVANAPVKVQNSIGTDMMMGGNCRDPCLVKYKAGCDENGKLQGVEVVGHLDQGCASDYSDFVLEEILFNVEGCYSIPNFRNKLTPHRTNTGSNTAFRGPGLVEAAAIGEQIIEAVAAAHGMDPTEFKLNNLMNPDKGVMPVTCLNATIPEYNVHKIVEHILGKSEYYERKKAVDEYNAAHKWTKKGIAIMPLRFAHTHGFSQGQTVLVNVSASDGSVSAWTTGCEIGQGLFVKVAGTISQALGVDINKVSVMEVNTQVTPNAKITGGSTTSECCCSAARNACDILKERLKPLKDHMTKVSGGEEPTWEELCKKSNGGGPGADQAGWDGYTPFTPDAIHVNLSASGIHQPKGRTVKDLLGESTMGNNLNGTTTGHGITDYFSTGASVSEVQVDVLTGVKTILRTDLVQDCGHSLNPQIDIGQCEGAFVIGLGFYLQEEVMIDPTNGFNHSHDTWEYKPCLNRDIPIEFNVELLKDSPFGETIDFEPVRGAKAVGEPPLLLALSAFNAVRAAVTASRVERGLSPQFKLEMPATVDRIQQALEMDSAEYAL